MDMPPHHPPKCLYSPPVFSPLRLHRPDNPTECRTKASSYPRHTSSRYRCLPIPRKTRPEL
ncbi:hypothetical protein OF83DRAFT_1119715 [Amylostereum chailletii]|nr:hypothetical protein OF83DRAFT_1119715 [Amylostereum chailletii]